MSAHDDIASSSHHDQGIIFLPMLSFHICRHIVIAFQPSLVKSCTHAAPKHHQSMYAAVFVNLLKLIMQPLVLRTHSMLPSARKINAIYGYVIIGVPPVLAVKIPMSCVGPKDAPPTTVPIECSGLPGLVDPLLATVLGSRRTGGSSACKQREPETMLAFIQWLLYNGQHSRSGKRRAALA